MKISKLLLSSIAVSAFAGAVVAGNAVTAVSDALVRDSEIKFTDFGANESVVKVGEKSFYADVVDTVTVKGLPEDNYKVQVTNDNNVYLHGEFTMVTTGDDAYSVAGMIDGDNLSKNKKALYVNYEANKKGTNLLGAYLKPDTAVVDVTVTEHCDDDVVYSKSYDVLGYMPGMTFENNNIVVGGNPFKKVIYFSDEKKSFDENLEMVAKKKIFFNQATVDTTYFVMAGYAGANYGKAVAKVNEIKYAGKEDQSQISCKLEKVDAKDAKVKYVGADGKPVKGVSYQQYWEENGFEGQLYRAIVTYKPAVGGNFVDATIVIGDEVGLNQIELTVNASDTQIDADAISFDFPREGGAGQIRVVYSGFEGPENNAGQTIKAYMQSQKDTHPVHPSVFKLKFLDSRNGEYPVVESNPLNGSGIIVLNYECEKTSENDITSVEEDVIVIEVNDKKIEIPVTRTNPNIRIVKESNEIVFGENIDDVTKEIAYVVTNFIHYYNIQDYTVYTTSDAFRVNEVKRVHKGILMQPNKDYEATITVLYAPMCSTEDHYGTLYIENTKTGDICSVALKGIAPVNAKGYTGVNNAEAATKAGAIYNVGGAAVNANAKGLVIENGKVIFK